MPEISRTQNALVTAVVGSIWAIAIVVSEAVALGRRLTGHRDAVQPVKWKS